MYTRAIAGILSVLFPAFLLLLCSREPGPRTPSFSKNPRLTALYRKADALFQARRYREAAELNRDGYRLSVAEGARASASRFLQNVAGCLFGLLRYREALQTYVAAREIAEQDGDWEIAGTTSLNISSLHLQMGEIDAAAEEARRGVEALGRAGSSLYRPQALFQLAKIECRRRGISAPAVREMFQEALASADAQGKALLAAQIWNYLGIELLNAGHIERADRALANAFRLRKLSKSADLDSSFRALALLRLAQGRLDSAAVLADAALAESVRRPGRVPNWNAYHCRGRVRLAQGHYAQAAGDFRTALALAARWRLDTFPSDPHRISVDAAFHDLADSFVEAAAGSWSRTRDPSLAAESFGALEGTRAASLRAVAIEGGRLQQLTPEYGELLARLRNAESAVARTGGDSERAQAQQLRFALTMAELRAGLHQLSQPAKSREPLETVVRAALGADEALLSFHLGETASYVWALTRDCLELHPLAPARDLSRTIAEFRSAVLAGAGRESGRAAWNALFGALGSRIHGKRNWTLVLDAGLFDAPLAAARSPAGRYLLEEHAVRVLPSAQFVLRSRPALAGKLLAVADAIYNRADPRAAGAGLAHVVSELPRLPGTAAEARSCAAAWRLGPRSVLEGASASRRALETALASRPSALHIAAHVVVPENSPARARIALSVQRDGTPDALTVSDIAGLRGGARLVVLSGCNSGRGAARPGAGLLGLTRAWLAAGAAGVVATLWPATDSNAAFFGIFYSRLSDQLDAAEALREAQLTVLRSGRARPRDWAAWILVGI